MTTFQKVTLPSVYSQYQVSLKPFELALMRALLDQSLNLDSILNRGLRFEDNCDMRVLDFTSSGTPDAENTAAHTLGKIPTGFLVASIDKACSVYKGTTAYTASNIYLKVNAATVAVKIIVF